MWCTGFRTHEGTVPYRLVRYSTGTAVRLHGLTATTNKKTTVADAVLRQRWLAGRVFVVDLSTRRSARHGGDQLAGWLADSEATQGTDVLSTRPTGTVVLSLPCYRVAMPCHPPLLGGCSRMMHALAARDGGGRGVGPRVWSDMYHSARWPFTQGMRYCADVHTDGAVPYHTRAGAGRRRATDGA